MKVLLTLSVILIVHPLYLFSAKIIKWDQIGQKEQIFVGENFSMVYGKLNPENTKVIIEPTTSKNVFTLEIIPFSKSDKEYALLFKGKLVSDSLADYYKLAYDKMKNNIQLIESRIDQIDNETRVDTFFLDRIRNTVDINNLKRNNISEMSEQDIKLKQEQNSLFIEQIKSKIGANNELEIINKNLINEYTSLIDQLDNSPESNIKKKLFLSLIDSLSSLNKKLMVENEIYTLEKQILEKDKLLFETEIESQVRIRNYIIAITILIVLILVYYYVSFLKKKKINEILNEQKKTIEIERNKSDELLLNVLPPIIANRLKSGEKTISDYFNDVSVVFIDISQFTFLSKDAKPERIVKVLNKIYTEFDKIADKYGLEKIKTIGDCYMAAAGIPIKMERNQVAAANFALEILSKMKDYDTGDGTLISFRIGIDCGPVVAGVIGEKKFIYDLWGDTVNTASRMEEYGEPGRIQVTERFKAIVESRQSSVESQFRFEERGEIEVKGKGMMRTWFLVGSR